MTITDTRRGGPYMSGLWEGLWPDPIDPGPAGTPRRQRPVLEVRTLGYAPPEKLNDSDGPTHVPLSEAPEGKTENLVCSELADGTHLPCLDIDFPARLIPSSTPGHFHLYLDGMESLSWEAYEKFLRALAEAGVISWGYFRHSQTRKMTCLRRPGTHKGDV